MEGTMNDDLHGEPFEPTQPSEPIHGAAGDEPFQSGPVTAELQELGRRLSATTRALWASEQRQELQQEMSDGLRLLRDQLTEAVDALRSHPRTQSVKDQVNRATSSTRVNDLVDDVRGGLAGSLHELNQQLGRFTERVERQTAKTTPAEPVSTEPATPATSSEPVDIPVQTETTAPRSDLPETPEGPAHL
jgi:hypothetical protein